MGVLWGRFVARGDSANTKWPVVVFCKNFHAAWAANQVVEPEAGRMIQAQVINLVSGVVPRPSGITHATSDRVGSCGAKLLNGFFKSPVAGRPTASLPVRAQFITAPGVLASGGCFRERVRRQAIGLLLTSWAEKLSPDSMAHFSISLFRRLP